MICSIMIFWTILSRQMQMEKCCCSARMVSGDFVRDLLATNTHKKCHLRASVVIFWRLYRCICGDLVHPSLPVSVSVSLCLVCVYVSMCPCVRVSCVLVSVCPCVLTCKLENNLSVCLCVYVCSLQLPNLAQPCLRCLDMRTHVL